jgi:hypothetical protein
MSIAALRQRLSTLVAPPRASEAAISTGIAALDRALSDGGVPCGRLTEVAGAPGSGKTTLVRQLVAAALAAQRRVAYVDGARTLAPRDWAAAAQTGRLWVVRPPDKSHQSRSAWCADVLLRSGAFGLVVLDGGSGVMPLSRQVAVRLTRLAREHDAALVVVSEPGAGAVVGSAVRLRVERKTDRRQEAAGAGDGAGTGRPGGWRRRWRGPASLKSLGTGSGRVSRVLRIVVDKGGRHHSVEVHCAIDVARRLCAHPEIPDRRGVASRDRRGQRAGPDVPGAKPRGAPERGAPERTAVTLPRKRRCAEPAVQRDAFLLTGEGGRR